MYLGLCISAVCWKFIISKWLPRPSHPYVRHDKDRIKEYNSTAIQGGPPPYYAQYGRRHTYNLIIHIAFLALLAGVLILAGVVAVLVVSFNPKTGSNNRSSSTEKLLRGQ